jgi:hypothetical protein
MDKGNCSKCGQKIQKTVSDKCMYCGAPLEAAQVFTEEEKETISLNKKSLRKELHKKEMERLRKGRKSTAASGGFDIEIGLGGFGDGDGGE